MVGSPARDTVPPGFRGGRDRDVRRAEPGNRGGGPSLRQRQRAAHRRCGDDGRERGTRPGRRLPDHAEPEDDRHVEHGLRGDRGRPAPDQPEPLLALLSREAGVLPRGRRRVQLRGHRPGHARRRSPATGADVYPFFSRRVGLLEGQEVPIRAGGKLAGRAGPRRARRTRCAHGWGATASRKRRICLSGA